VPNRELEGLYAEFHLHPVLQAEESRKQAREIYKDALYIQIQIKGQKNQIRDRKATKEDEQDFPTAWHNWQNKETSAINGTPSTALPGVGPSLAIELQTLGLYTVEDIAKLPDSAMDKFRGAQLLRQRAIAYLKASEVVPEKTIEIKIEEEDPVDADSMKNDPHVITAKRRGRPPKNRVIQ